AAGIGGPAGLRAAMSSRWAVRAACRALPVPFGAHRWSHRPSLWNVTYHYGARIAESAPPSWSPHRWPRRVRRAPDPRPRRRTKAWDSGGDGASDVRSDGRRGVRPPSVLAPFEDS